MTEKKDIKKENKKDKQEHFSLGWKRFFSELKKRRMTAILLLALTFIGTLIFSSEKYIVGKILDSLVNSQVVNFFCFNIEKVYVFIALFMLVVLIWKSMALYTYHFLGLKASNNLYKEYTTEIFSKLISYPNYFFKENSIGKITYSINTGARTLSDGFVNMMDMSRFPLLIISNIVFLFFISWHVGLSVMLATGVYIFIFKRTFEKRQKVTKEFNDEKKGITNFLTDNINHAIEVKKNVGEKKESVALKERMGGSFREKFYNDLYFNLSVSVLTNIVYLVFGVINLLLLVWLYKNNFITEGGFLSAILYESAIANNIGFIVRNMNKYVEDFTIIGDTEKLLQHAPENYSEGKKPGEVKGEVEFKDIDFQYQTDMQGAGEKKVFSLSNVNLKISKGQKVAFVGESGGGKSTSVELVGGFYFPTSGEMLIDGVKTTDWNLHDLRGAIAYVSQDIAIFNSTIGGNIAYGAIDDISDEKIVAAAKMAHIHEFIEGLPDGYKTSVGEKGLKLSGGQKQRIAIARAILRDPKILILDEPTSALDIASEKYITESLKTLMKGRTTIIIAHRLSTVADADKIFVFKDGKIAEEGNFQSLISQNGEFKKMVDLHEQLQ